MKRGTIWIALTCLMVTSLVLASCNNTSTATTSTSTSTNTSTTSTTTKTTNTTTTSPTTTTTTTTATTGNWWDSLGTPQYGGEMVMRLNSNIVNFDPYFNEFVTNIDSAWLQRLFADDWTMDPAVYSYRTQFRPSQYVKGQLAESWEFTDPSTYVVHLRKGIFWQNIPPANGREFTADDVVFHFDRFYGLGGGFTKVDPYHTTDPEVGTLISVTATDKYTVVFKWNVPNPELIFETLQTTSTCTQSLENPDAVKLWGDANDWHHAIGTGPWILHDFVSSSSATLVKNPNYWGYDERYPQNKLPYIDKLTILIITDDVTALAALRTGKIDALDGISLSQAQDLQKTNPEISQLSYPVVNTRTIEPRNDVKPFNDIRVRKAMQMAIDLPTIAKTYYAGTADPYPSTLTSNYMTGWGFPYNQWPQDLKDEYAYNPAAAKQLLADAGYPNGFKTDLVVSSTADLDLFQIVKSYFAAVGIDMDIRPMDFASWTAFVQAAHKNDQLAATASGSLGEGYEPLRQLTRFVTGNSANWNMVSDPIFEAFYTKAEAATSVEGVQQALRDADEYVARQHFSISLLQPNLFVFYQPWLKGYSGQFGVISASSGPQFLSFYQARFWIDQNLKKSMGH